MPDGEVNRRLLAAARAHEWVDDALLSVPELAEDEKNLFLAMLRALPEQLRCAGRSSLEVDEVVSLFNFVYAKAAEAVTHWYTGNAFEPSLEGMLDGETPLYADERLVESFRDCPVAEVLSGCFLESPIKGDPLLTLFEALKLAWRISCHLALGWLEERGMVKF